MISVNELIKAYESESDAKIVCTDGQVIIGDVISVDDEDESGLGEIGISLFTPDGGFIGIGLSEIESISTVENEVVSPLYATV